MSIVTAKDERTYRPRQNKQVYCPKCRCLMRSGSTGAEYTYYYCQDARCPHFSDSVKVARPPVERA